MRRRIADWFVVPLLAGMLAASEGVFAEQPEKTSLHSAGEFDRVFALVRPLPGEYAWRDEIPWEGRIQNARIKAAAEDKPILIIASANAFALGRT